MVCRVLKAAIRDPSLQYSSLLCIGGISQTDPISRLRYPSPRTKPTLPNCTIIHIHWKVPGQWASQGQRQEPSASSNRISKMFPDLGPHENLETINAVAPTKREGVRRQNQLSPRSPEWL